jgi:hypothetical protein
MIISTPEFCIEADTARSLLTMALIGFWDRATLDAYSSSLNRAGHEFSQSGIRPPTVQVLVDLRDHQVQSHEAAAELQKILEGLAPVDRCAVILPASSIKKTQVTRTVRVCFENHG